MLPDLIEPLIEQSVAAEIQRVPLCLNHQTKSLNRMGGKDRRYGKTADGNALPQGKAPGVQSAQLMQGFTAAGGGVKQLIRGQHLGSVRVQVIQMVVGAKNGVAGHLLPA